MRYRFGGRTSTFGSWRRGVVLSAATGVAAVVFGACASGSEPTGDVAQGPAPGEAVEVVIADMAFEPDVLRLEPGHEVTVEVTNEDSMPHDFVVESLDVATGTIESGGVATATFTAPPGDIKFVCTIHPNMKGRIEVTPGT
jgi:nitrite reductase (NO-forming)